MRRITHLLALLATSLCLTPLLITAVANATDSAAAPLQFDSAIPLGNVHGRIDHMAFDATRRRLFVAELGNDSLGVVDIEQGKVIRTINGLSEPQGVGYAPSTDTVYVANGGDGSVRLFEGTDLKPTGTIDLKDDADNVRVDAAANSVWVGYGAGALAMIDAPSHTKVSDVPLRDHPEGFQLDPEIDRIIVNVPDAGEIAVIDRASGKQVASWKAPRASGNFPMAIGYQGKEIAVVFRHPSKFVIFDADSGRATTDAETCGDADDVFFDAARRHYYVSCSEGFLDVFAAKGSGYARIGHIQTRAGARTSLFVPELDRLFIAVPATWTEPPAIWVYRPNN